jgi:ABC-type iron transport system FetAB permease component
MSDTEKAKIGTLSLWASILGIVIPILIAFLVRILVKVNDEQYYMLCILLFAGLELIAFITGFIGRKSPAGKAGMSISLVCTVLVVLALPMFVVQKTVDYRPKHISSK